MRKFARVLFKMHEERRDGVGYHWAFRIEQVIASDLARVDAKRLLKIGRIGPLNLKEVEALVSSKAISFTDEASYRIEVLALALVRVVFRIVGNDPDQAIFIFGQKAYGFRREFYI